MLNTQNVNLVIEKRKRNLNDIKSYIEDYHQDLDREVSKFNIQAVDKMFTVNEGVFDLQVIDILSRAKSDYTIKKYISLFDGQMKDLTSLLGRIEDSFIKEGKDVDSYFAAKVKSLKNEIGTIKKAISDLNFAIEV
ncbi:MAG: hypothetical protein CL760_09025 [Chloroflexi bacterium]|nr:hypothetical protein [Chloroflexota bacterium]|tara:strand:- start:43273 stop:43680 length:408 start_codon:yes stop_codon:yes gene_type:complete